ncbi:Aste57867_23277 [Aphanomyces stellatus]|uniref:Aste57867_23277 protein n=1 Tax=Aphanomyces stellatus TaxID=120398 RepID=A0A485LMD7_9STRA|nr:hypothetical protein As57867_023206 [Aphanomyces stellatus]VFT99922.1 Aste57867_23277 [Aphanomyces stellatus]
MVVRVSTAQLNERRPPSLAVMEHNEDAAMSMRLAADGTTRNLRTSSNSSLSRASLLLLRGVSSGASLAKTKCAAMSSSKAALDTRPSHAGVLSPSPSQTLPDDASPEHLQLTGDQVAAMKDLAPSLHGDTRTEDCMPQEIESRIDFVRASKCKAALSPNNSSTIDTMQQGPDTEASPSLLHQSPSKAERHLRVQGEQVKRSNTEYLNPSPSQAVLVASDIRSALNRLHLMDDQVEATEVVLPHANSTADDGKRPPEHGSPIGLFYTCKSKALLSPNPSGLIQHVPDSTGVVLRRSPSPPRQSSGDIALERTGSTSPLALIWPALVAGSPLLPCTSGSAKASLPPTIDASMSSASQTAMEAASEAMPLNTRQPSAGYLKSPSTAMATTSAGVNMTKLADLLDEITTSRSSVALGKVSSTRSGSAPSRRSQPLGASPSKVDLRAHLASTSTAPRGQPVSSKNDSSSLKQTPRRRLARTPWHSERNIRR